MKNSILLISCFLFIQQFYGQYTQVPDPNFEQALIDSGIDSEGILDGQFLTVDAENVAYLGVQNKNISDLTGIEAFVNLQWLDAFDNTISQIDFSLITSPVFYTLNLGGNQLTNVDLTPLINIVNLALHKNNLQSVDASNLLHLFGLGVSDQTINELTITNCPNLQVLDFVNTTIQNIDLTSAPVLINIYCFNSQIQSLDFTNNPILEEVWASNTPLSSINLPNNPNLENLFISNCQLTELDVTQCQGLLDLESSNNMLTSIDLSNNTLLEDLSLINNQLTSIDLSNNPNIFRFWASNNQLIGDIDFNGNPILEEVSLGNNLFTTLDLSLNGILEVATISDNPNLEMINIKNGNNLNMFWLSVFDCPSLTCIVVDDPLADNSFILVEQNVEINIVSSPEDCNLSISENELQNLINVYPNPVKNILFIKNNENIGIEKITVYDISGKIVFIENYSFDNYRYYQLNLSQLNTGVLFVKIETNKGVLVKKVVKE